jgi:hypothetical protein
MVQNHPLRLPPFQFIADPDPAFNFDTDPGPDPAFHCDADPYPVSQNDVDPCGFRSGSATLIYVTPMKLTNVRGKTTANIQLVFFVA